MKAVGVHYSSPKVSFACRRMQYTGPVLFRHGGNVSCACMQVVMAYAFATAVLLGVFWAAPNVAWIQWLIVAAVGFALYGPQMLIGLCGAEVVRKPAVSAAQGFLGWISYLGALLNLILKGSFGDAIEVHKCMKFDEVTSSSCHVSAAGVLKVDYSTDADVELQPSEGVFCYAHGWNPAEPFVGLNLECLWRRCRQCRSAAGEHRADIWMECILRIHGGRLRHHPAAHGPYDQPGELLAAPGQG